MTYARVAAICFALALACVGALAYANEHVVREYVAAYNAGNVSRLPLAEGATQNASDSALRDHAELFAATKARTLTLRNVRWSDTRITADYAALVDGRALAGSLTIYVADGRITRLVHDRITWPESELNLADIGQALDKGTTAVALATGYTEVNPILSGITPAGAVVLGAGIIAARNLVVREMPLSECIEISRWVSAFGWGPGASNLAMMAGAGPAGWAVGLGCGVIAYHASYKGSCVDGPVRVAVIE